MLTDISNATVKAYYDLYTTPEDVDLWSAGVSERSIDDSIVGPTFGCIIAKTFSDLKKGDRFWYENPGLPNSFTLGNCPMCVIKQVIIGIWKKILEKKIYLFIHTNQLNFILLTTYIKYFFKKPISCNKLKIFYI